MQARLVVEEEEGRGLGGRQGGGRAAHCFRGGGKGVTMSWNEIVETAMFGSGFF